MLSSFFIRNFRSILELRLDFSFAEGKAPNGYKSLALMPFLEAQDGRRLVPCIGFFGANASGKSNILKALGALKHLAKLGSELADVFEPNLLNPKFQETTLEAGFFLGPHHFTYRITYSAASITEEVLQKDGEPIFAISRLQPKFAPQLFSAAFPKEKLEDILRVECSDGEGRQAKSFLHRMGLGYPGLHQDLHRPFTYFESGLIFFPNTRVLPLSLSVDVLASAEGGDRSAALREITDVIRRLDIDIAAIGMTETELEPEDPDQRHVSVRRDQQTGNRLAINISSTHPDAAGNPKQLNFIKHESAGTQRLAGLVGYVLFALKTGGGLLVDELECSLHPLLMREIVLLFKNPRYNPKGAQLIFTTHNTDILDDSILRLSEIALVRKTTANGTLVRRLVDARNEGEDIRNVTNFRRQYLAGFYAGVPHPSL